VLTSLAWSHVPNKFMDIHSSVRPSRYFRDSLNAVLVPCWRSRDLWLVVVLHVSCVWGLDMQAGERRLDHNDCCWLGRYTEWAWQWMSRWATDTAASAALRLTQHTHAKSFTTHTRLTALSPGLPRWASTRKVKPIWILLKQETVWQWHQLGRMQVCTLLQTDNHTNTPPLSFFTGQVPFLPPNQHWRPRVSQHNSKPVVHRLSGLLQRLLVNSSQGVMNSMWEIDLCDDLTVWKVEQGNARWHTDNAKWIRPSVCNNPVLWTGLFGLGNYSSRRKQQKK